MSSTAIPITAGTLVNKKLVFCQLQLTKIESILEDHTARVPFRNSSAGHEILDRHSGESEADEVFLIRLPSGSRPPACRNFKGKRSFETPPGAGELYSEQICGANTPAQFQVYSCLRTRTSGRIRD